MIYWDGPELRVRHFLNSVLKKGFFRSRSTQATNQIGFICQIRIYYGFLCQGQEYSSKFNYLVSKVNQTTGTL